MSVKYIAKAWESAAEGNALLLLLALSDYANDEGELFPSLQTITKKSKIKKTTLTYIIRAFEEIGVINRTQRQRENGSDTSNVYKLLRFDFTLEEYVISYQKIRNYKAKSSHCEPPIVHNVTPPVHNVTPPKHRVSIIQSSHCGPLEPSLINKTNKRETPHTDINFQRLLTETRLKAKIKSKAHINDKDIVEVYKAYLKIEDKNIIENRYLTLHDKDKYSKTLKNFILDFDFEISQKEKSKEVEEGWM